MDGIQQVVGMNIDYLRDLGEVREVEAEDDDNVIPVNPGEDGPDIQSSLIDPIEIDSVSRELNADVTKSGRGTFESDKPPVVTPVCRSDGRVRFLVRENLEDVDEEIVEYGDEDDPAILCTDQYSIYDGIDESDEIDGHLAINHDEHYVVDDVHTNSCENRHSFLRSWLRRFRGVSKQHLQGYLNFFSLTLNTDQWSEKIVSTDFDR